METEETSNVNPPDLIVFPGVWSEYVEVLYSIFRENFREGLFFQGIPVKTKRHPEYKGKDFTFWHLTSSGKKEEERDPDLRRCERLNWVFWMIKFYNNHPHITFWENKRESDRNVVILYDCKNDHFAVILSKRNSYYLLKTAYCVHSHRIKALRRERDEYYKANKN